MFNFGILVATVVTRQTITALRPYSRVHTVARLDIDHYSVPLITYQNADGLWIIPSVKTQEAFGEIWGLV